MELTRNELIEECILNIQELESSAIITPVNLLSNAYLEDYDYVKYYKANGSDEGLLVEMKYCCGDGVNRVFLYTFDDNDWIMKLEEISPCSTVLFDREVELHEVMKDFYFLIQ